MKSLLVLENDGTLEKERHRHVFKFIESYDGKVVLFTSFGSKKDNEIYQAVTKCTDIYVQTCFINGSDYQFDDMVLLLSKISQPKNVTITLFGSDLYDYIDSHLTDEQLVSIRHHNIFKYGYKEDYSCMESVQLDFTARVEGYLNQQKRVADYNNTAQQRPTGRKIKIIACNACGNAFKSLVFGSIVDELDLSETDPNPDRGVWVWGNGEPVKLINDCGLKEYAIASELDFDGFADEVKKCTPLNINSLKRIELEGLLAVLNDEDYSPMEVANFICEETGIEKRHNRSNINALVIKYRENLKQAV